MVAGVLELELELCEGGEKIGASPGTRGRKGWVAGFGCLPTLGTQVRVLLEMTFCLLPLL